MWVYLCSQLNNLFIYSPTRNLERPRLEFLNSSKLYTFSVRFFYPHFSAKIRVDIWAIVVPYCLSCRNCSPSEKYFRTSACCMATFSRTVRTASQPKAVSCSALYIFSIARSLPYPVFLGLSLLHQTIYSRQGTYVESTGRAAERLCERIFFL